MGKQEGNRTVPQGGNIQDATWDFFDRIYCISLHKREDRRNLVVQEFAAVGLLDRVEFVLVDPHPVNREQGIFESHMHCLAKGLAAGVQSILIFEDDVFFRRFNPRTLAAACDDLVSLPQWNAFFLGCITSGSRRITGSSLAAVNYRCLSHGYAVHKNFAEEIVCQLWRGTPYDTMLKEQCRKYYALYPMCVFQGLSTTDNQTVVIDRLRRLLGGLPFLQRVNEFYQNNKTVLLFSHLAGMGLLFFWWLR